MAVPPSPIPPGMMQAITQSIYASRSAAAAALTGGIIAAAGRPHSIDEAMEIYTSVYFTMYPEPGRGRYQAGAANMDATLAEATA